MTAIRSIETFTADDVTVVRVRCEDGADGFGQTGAVNADITAEVLHRQVAPHALGHDADDIDGLIERCHDREAKFLGSYLARALGGVDTALWDLRAKRAGKSVAGLLGARTDRIRVYGSYLRRDTRPEEVADRLARCRDEEGYTAFKVKIGKRRGHDADQWPGRTPQLVALLRRRFPDAVELLADANSCYSPDRAIEVGRMLEDHGFRQFEEPCPHTELEWTAAVAAALDLDVCGGEQDHSLHQFRRMIALRAVDVVQPDVGYVGGFTQALRVAEAAAEANVICQPHAGERSMIMVFALHLIASVRNPGPFAECSTDPGRSPRQRIFAPAIRVEDGHVRLPDDGPGWGVTVDPGWMRRARHRVSGRGRLRISRIFRTLRRRLIPVW